MRRGTSAFGSCASKLDFKCIVISDPLGMADWPADQIPHPSRGPPYPHQHHANVTAPPAGLAMNGGDVLRNAETCALSWDLVSSLPKGDAITAPGGSLHTHSSTP
jgi:hypothetical protein